VFFFFFFFENKVFGHYKKIKKNKKKNLGVNFFPLQLINSKNFQYCLSIQI